MGEAVDVLGSGHVAAPAEDARQVVVGVVELAPDELGGDEASTGAGANQAPTEPTGPTEAASKVPEWARAAQAGIAQITTEADRTTQDGRRAEYWALVNYLSQLSPAQYADFSRRPVADLETGSALTDAIFADVRAAIGSDEEGNLVSAQQPGSGATTEASGSAAAVDGRDDDDEDPDDGEVAGEPGLRWRHEDVAPDADKDSTWAEIAAAAPEGMVRVFDHATPHYNAEGVVDHIAVHYRQGAPEAFPAAPTTQTDEGERKDESTVAAATPETPSHLANLGDEAADEITLPQEPEEAEAEDASGNEEVFSMLTQAVFGARPEAVRAAAAHARARLGTEHASLEDIKEQLRLDAEAAAEKQRQREAMIAELGLARAAELERVAGEHAQTATARQAELSAAQTEAQQAREAEEAARTLMEQARAKAEAAEGLAATLQPQVEEARAAANIHGRRAAALKAKHGAAAPAPVQPAASADDAPQEA